MDKPYKSNTDHLVATYKVFESTGELVDGGHVILKCQNCKAPLVDLWITEAKKEYVWKIEAKCCHCNDRSKVVTIKGGFRLGNTDYTNYGTVDINTDCITIHTNKGLKEWK